MVLIRTGGQGWEGLPGWVVERWSSWDWRVRDVAPLAKVAR